jgi:hypothetical protein
MNPFQTAYSRTNTAAKQMHMHPAAAHALEGTIAAASLAPTVGGGIDLAVGDSHAFNSGEIPLNYLIAALGGLTTSGAVLGSEAINKQLDKYYKGSVDKTPSNVSAHDPAVKAKMKEIHRTQGPDAAAAYYASQKNPQGGGAREGTYTNAGAGRRRMAGALLSALLGAGVSLPLMVDDSY